MKNITILGSTGSIGVNVLKVIQANPNKYRCVGLAAGKNIDLLAEQTRHFRPGVICIQDSLLVSQLKNRLGGEFQPDILHGTQGVIQIATLSDVDTVISAMSGAAGLLPTYEAIRAGKNIALANKETIVMAGAIIMAEAKKKGVSVLPVDSEHSAIFQSLQGHPREDIRRVILTASGGPFRNLSVNKLRRVTPDQALKHPNWEMGKKVTIDSATLMNKGLEAIEARWLFNLDMDQISILIHPQSVVHSMVEYNDGSVIAQMGIPDMIIPISYALSYPHHDKNNLPPLELDQVGELTFEKPDLKKFRCLELALNAAKTGGSMPAVMNGANEMAVEAFLEGKIGFLDIPDVIEKTMDAHQKHGIDNVADVLASDRWARGKTREVLDRWK